MAQGYIASLVEKAKKILGDDAKFPKEKGDLEKAYTDVKKAADDFSAARDSLEDKILSLQNTASIAINIMRQNYEVFSKDDFGLDAKSKDDSKKVKAAHEIFDGINLSVKVWEQHLKVIDELDKHCIEMGKYKPPKT